MHLFNYIGSTQKHGLHIIYEPVIVIYEINNAL